jgi:hypothetical protein
MMQVVSASPFWLSKLLPVDNVDGPLGSARGRLWSMVDGNKPSLPCRFASGDTQALRTND